MTVKKPDDDSASTLSEPRTEQKDAMEMTKLCAEAMDWYWPADDNQNNIRPDPLHDDAQAMALVKRFGLQISARKRAQLWTVAFPFENQSGYVGHHAVSSNLNRAIVECCARMQAASVIGSDNAQTK